jgi:starvation-inducible DNA-binding protein
MSFRLKAFIIAVILAILTSYTQEPVSPPADKPLQNLTFTETPFPTPPVMEEPAPVLQEVEENVSPSAPSQEMVEREAATGNGVNIGLSAQVRQKEATFLNTLLSDEYVLYTKTLKCHWNVQGIVFHDFHAMFKEQYEKLFEIIDLIAERARALGAPALGSLQEFKTLSRLKEITTNTLTPIQMVQELLADHELLIRTIRSAINESAQLGDQGTSNFLQDLIIRHEKIAWMLRATAQ